jgi:hypothetical protein
MYVFSAPPDGPAPATLIPSPISLPANGPPVQVSVVGDDEELMEQVVEKAPVLLGTEPLIRYSKFPFPSVAMPIVVPSGGNNVAVALLSDKLPLVEQLGSTNWKLVELEAVTAAP